MADDWSDESLKGKLVIQTKSVQGGSNDEDFNPEQGDHRKSMWDISDDSFVDSDIVEQELEVHLKLLHPGQRSPSSPVLSLTRVASSMRQSTPTCPGSNESSSSVIDSIQELMTKNEELKRTVDELEAMHQMDLDMLEEARQEIEEAKMKSLITSNLLKQVDDLTIAKETLEEEIALLKERDMERKTALLEKDAIIHALQVESIRLSKDNLALKEKEHISYQRGEASETALSYQGKCSHEFSLPKEYLNPKIEAASFWSRSRVEAEKFLTQSIEVLESKSLEPKSWACHDEAMLMFLKTMTLIFGGLSLIAAFSMLFSDLKSGQ